MKRIFIFIIVFWVVFVKTNASCIGCPDKQRSYSDSLMVLVQTLRSEEVVIDNLLLFCIPISSEENLKFIELDYSKDKNLNKIFRDINDLWTGKCLLKNAKFLKSYFEYSRFVDGYFAEDYFINIDKLYKELGKILCKELNKCPMEKTQRLRLYLEENNYCN